MLRELKVLGLSSDGAIREPLISSINQTKGPNLLQIIKNWNFEKFRNVMWSNKSKFSLLQNDGRTRVGREPHEEIDPSCILSTVQATGGSIVI